MQKTCLNPSCKERFEPGRYGRRQRICGRIGCKRWYKVYWSQTRRTPRGIPDESFERMQRACRGDVFHHALLMVARYSGLRKGELLGLAWQDVVRHDGKIRKDVDVRGQWKDGEGFCPTKTRGSRFVMMDSACRTAIGELRSTAKRKKADRVFPISESGAYKWFVVLQKSVRVKNPDTGYPFRFHDLRHSVGKELVRAGRADLAKKQLGHTKIETTMIYAEQTTDEALEDIERIRKRGRTSSGGED